MTESASDRALLLLRTASLKELAAAGSTEYVRWQNIKRGRARLGIVEAEILAKVYPKYALWLITGETAPEIGQSSPEYDEANSKLPSHNAG